jgi:hypothetical protein
MTQRVRQSPVLGYNHNLRHGGRVFHVQTEDSGQGYARLHTHLFYEGTILSSKKQEYDPASPEDKVRTLMQQLHKAMIKELTHGEHDARIGAFFVARGEPAMLDEKGAPAAPKAAPPAATPAPAVVESAVAKAQVELPPASAARPAPAPIAAAATPAPAKPVVMVKPGGVRRPPVVLSSSADGVVVRRNVVINVGGGAPPVNGTPSTSRPPAQAASAPSAPEKRPRPQAPIAASDGVVVPNKGAARAAAPTTESAPQPLASSREIRMPWETPGPSSRPSGQQPIITNVPASARRQNSLEVKMPWDPPAAKAPAGGDAFAAELGDDKGLDEVILEYLSDDSETEER